MKDSKDVTNLLLVGVGGQGVVVASKILTEAALLAGFDVKKSEVHGMAQRGGSVVSQVRFGPTVYSPLIKRGEADVLLSFEQLETLRYLEYLSTRALVILNNHRILPPSVSMGVEAYPEDIATRVKKLFKHTYLVEGIELAREAGNPKALNTALLGVLSRHLDISEKHWLKVIQKQFPPHLHAINIQGFQLGREYILT
ncbi:MAG TPA: indolepyruvate oxidoreductase subunit beta [Thermodesulfobacteriota bacterium]|nr:indolepyruvate oxidoreductase subunit beta [Thermodesulfobacteriota bacterium]